MAPPLLIVERKKMLPKGRKNLESKLREVISREVETF
jgi:hypothetical protein